MAPESDPSSRDALLAAFLADAPPRRVPPEIRKAAGRQAPSLFFGMFGLFFGGMGLFFVWLFFPWNFYRDWQLRDVPTAPGRILSAGRTSMKINRQYVFRYEFDFTPPTGGPIHGTSFTSGQQWYAGTTVAVRYLPDNPAQCCIDGARSSEGSAGSAFVVLFPTIGAALVAWAIVARRRLRFLLEHGQVGEARVTAVEATNTQINKQRVYRITLQRADAAAGAPCTVRRYEPTMVAFARDRLASNQPVFVLFDPAHPERLLLPEALL